MITRTDSHEMCYSRCGGWWGNLPVLIIIEILLKRFFGLVCHEIGPWVVGTTVSGISELGPILLLGFLLRVRIAHWRHLPAALVG